MNESRLMNYLIIPEPTSFVIIFVAGEWSREVYMQYMCVYSDTDGESHFADVAVEFQEVDFSSPTPPVRLSPFTPATQWAFFTLPPGWRGDWHPTPQRQIFFYLAGAAEIEVSDGEIRRFKAGDAALLFEDTTGKGHRSRVVGPEPLLLVVVQLPDAE